MAINKTCQLHPKAESDLEDIYLYTHQHHGLHQAESYIRQIETALQNLPGNLAWLALATTFILT